MFPVDCLLTAGLDSNAHGHGTFRIRVSIWDLSSRRVWGCFLLVAATCKIYFLSGGCGGGTIDAMVVMVVMVVLELSW